MNHLAKAFALLTTALLVILLPACRGEEEIINSTSTRVAPSEELKDVGGFYLLNEGNMGSNKATLDFYSYATGVYRKNIYPEQNPSVVKELGDVGNDLKLYGSRLWAVINVSNLVEVMDARTAKHLGSISIPNGRYLAFQGRYAYISSYAGEVKIDPNARLGYVAKVDTATLEVVATCPVGYQPEEMAILGDKLYVANSGGYRVPNYDNTVSVIDLNTFTEEAKIPVAINLHHLLADSQGLLWVSSRGDHHSQASSLHVLDPQQRRVIKSFDIQVTNMARFRDRIYLYGQDYVGTNKGKPSYTVIDTRTLTPLPEPFIPQAYIDRIKTPYGLAINPETGEILIADAGNYVLPGRVYSFSPRGVERWQAQAGQIPAHFAFVPKHLATGFDAPQPPIDDRPQPPTQHSPYITRVLEYLPGAGQFVNELPPYEAGDTEASMCAKVLNIIGGKGDGYVTLGGWGGYVTVGFDHTIENRDGLRDFRVLGNAFSNFGVEPGIIYVAYDRNRNGRPDEDEWYEIAGQAHRDLASIPWLEEQRRRGKDVAFYRDYAVTYHRPTSEGEPRANIPHYIRWVDNKGGTGYLHKNEFHSQTYYPAWITTPTYTLRGTRLPQNGYNSQTDDNPYFLLMSLAYGYADMALNDDDESAIDIDWAIDRRGKPVKLPGVDFIRIQTGVLQDNGWIGECSTEVAGIHDLHLLGKKIPTRTF